MNIDKTSNPDISAMIAQGGQQARAAMENYLQFFQKSILSSSPWAGTELNSKLADYARRNVETALGFSQQLTQAKDMQDLVRIQSEFFQSQLRSLTEQAKDLSDAATAASKGNTVGSNPAKR